MGYRRHALQRYDVRYCRGRSVPKTTVEAVTRNAMCNESRAISLNVTIEVYSIAQAYLLVRLR
jgi:hypothetical protein